MPWQSGLVPAALRVLAIRSPELPIREHLKQVAVTQTVRKLPGQPLPRASKISPARKEGERERSQGQVLWLGTQSEEQLLRAPGAGRQGAVPMVTER